MLWGAGHRWTNVVPGRRCKDLPLDVFDCPSGDGHHCGRESDVLDVLAVFRRGLEDFEIAKLCLLGQKLEVFRCIGLVLRTRLQQARGNPCRSLRFWGCLVPARLRGRHDRNCRPGRSGPKCRVDTCLSLRRR